MMGMPTFFVLQHRSGPQWDPSLPLDGQSDWQETRAGTDPMRATSYFGIASMSIGSGGARVIRIFSVPGKTYQLQAKSALSDPVWLNVGEATTASDSLTTIIHSTAGQKRAVYRVQLVE